MSEDPKVCDLVVVGGGAAGLYAALCGARAGARVALVSAQPLAATASYWAQGGLAAALATEDSVAQHWGDTVAAGRKLVRHSAAQVLCEQACERVHDLESLGVGFDRNRGGQLELGLEGGHSVRRVVHANGSATGRRLLEDLSVVVKRNENIAILERQSVSALLLNNERECSGVSLAGKQLLAGAVILATGGAAALWSRTTNPPGSFGAGLLLAHAAGAKLADLEFVQFHPTAVTGVAGREGFLISEAVRGEGATLTTTNGERFIDELAPRDIVARAIYSRLKTPTEQVYLDMRSVPATRFPNVFEALRSSGHDPAHDPVPVAPAAHYMMGGVATDLDGRTAVDRLYAVGECACTGLHGANRLASNSLSECFVFARRAVLAALSALGREEQANQELIAAEGGTAPSEQTRRAMWRHAGLERDREGLSSLLADHSLLAQLIARCALARMESRGGHQRTDYPETRSDLDEHHSVIAAGTQKVEFEHWE